MSAQDIVAVGFLTSRDLAMLGDGFKMHFPVQDSDMFDELLRRLDGIEATPCGEGVTIMPAKSR
jgi:hypothetical protein